MQPASAELGTAPEPNYRQQPGALLTYLWRYPNGSKGRFAAAQAPGAIPPRQCPCTTFHAKYSDGRKQ